MATTADLLGALDKIPNKSEIIDWIYHHQVVPVDAAGAGCGGFVGGGFSGPAPLYRQAHISMTYTALAALCILGDNFARVDREAVVNGLRALQRADGRFMAVPYGTESDMRFVFCAAAVSFMLQDWRGIDIEAATRYVLSTRSFDGGIGLEPGLESHGGSCYCGLAALALMGTLGQLPGRSAVVHFCVNRVVEGFNGRVNKPSDTCYTFWVGGSLQIIGGLGLVDMSGVRSFILDCQSARTGGFCKLVGAPPDVLHSHYSVCGLSLMGEPGFRTICATLGISRRAWESAPFHDGKCGVGTSASVLLTSHPIL